MTVVVRSVVPHPDSSRVLGAITPRYRVTDEHDIPPSHFKLTLNQQALL